VRLHELVGDQHADIAAPVVRHPLQIADFERGLAEEMFCSLLLEHKQRALNRSNRGLSNIPVFRGELAGAISQVLQQRLQVLEIEQRQLFVGDFEGDIEHAFLRLAQVHQAGQKERAQFGDGGADRMALLAEQVPEDDRIGLVILLVADLLVARLDPCLGPPCSAIPERSLLTSAQNTGTP